MLRERKDDHFEKLIAGTFEKKYPKKSISLFWITWQKLLKYPPPKEIQLPPGCYTPWSLFHANPP